MVKIRTKDIVWKDFIQTLSMMRLSDTSEEIYRTVIISDELFEELSGVEPKGKLGDDWEDVGRCPKCGEYVFVRDMRKKSLIKYSAAGDEELVTDLTTPICKTVCRCGVTIVSD